MAFKPEGGSVLGFAAICLLSIGLHGTAAAQESSFEIERGQTVSHKYLRACGHLGSRRAFENVMRLPDRGSPDIVWPGDTIEVSRSLCRPSVLHGQHVIEGGASHRKKQALSSPEPVEEDIQPDEVVAETPQSQPLQPPPEPEEYVNPFFDDQKEYDAPSFTVTKSQKTKTEAADGFGLTEQGRSAQAKANMFSGDVGVGSSATDSTHQAPTFELIDRQRGDTQ